MFLLAGLGNPGANYTHTRHNVGFIVLDAILANQQHLAKLPLNWQSKAKFQADIVTANIVINELSSEKVIFAKPYSFMNLSGKSIAAIANFYKIPTDNIIIVHDELDLPLGQIKYKFSGGTAGHNGLKSINSMIGPAYHRLRVGIGRPAQQERAIADYVLGKFSASEYDIIQNNIISLMNILPLLLTKQFEKISKELKIK